MEINIREYKGGKVIEVLGEIDLYSSPLLRNQLMFFVKKKESLLIVDFGGVSYIDSSGIATFVEGLKGVMSFGGKMKMFGLRPAIMEIFSFSKLDKVFDIYGTIEDACNS
ncbi:MAG: STAS domain-containing protein [Nitrospirae bacterium]|nr:STAS domain-containing protein [Nitrospirota bacterium]